MYNTLLSIGWLLIPGIQPGERMDTSRLSVERMTVALNRILLLECPRAKDEIVSRHFHLTFYVVQCKSRCCVTVEHFKCYEKIV
jgi:hypothetical protein